VRARPSDGRELEGAARTSFLAKCEREACEPKAIGSDGKPLRGAAKTSFMAKCERERAGLSSRIALTRAIRVTAGQAFATCKYEAADKKPRLSSFA
jgi:hypothetical protein